MNELLRKEHPPGLSYNDGRCSQMLQKEPAQLAFANSKTIGKLFYTALLSIQSAFADQSERTRNGIRSPSPRCELRSGLRTAAETGTITCFLSTSGRTIKRTVLILRSASGANRPAVDSGGLYANIDQPVESRIPALQGLIDVALSGNSMD
jgi:hypothetical protein